MSEISYELPLCFAQQRRKRLETARRKPAEGQHVRADTP